MAKLKLYAFWMSSCSSRVRIALHLKGLDYEEVPIDLAKGEHESPEFLKLNPLGCVPVLVDGEIVVTDSYAILMYLEEKYPVHPLLPQNVHKKALNIQAAMLIFGNIHPFQNLIILYIKERVMTDEMLASFQHRIQKGFSALEKLLQNHAGKYATGNEVFLADLFLAPQIDSAVTRFGIDMKEFPLLYKMNESYKENPAFQDAMRGKQINVPPHYND